MKGMMAACGVMCSDCPAYLGASKGATHQRRTADAWLRIYDLKEPPGNISCGGCLGRDDELFHTSRKCKARRCCRSRGFASCAACPEQSCTALEKAQSLWDEVPDLSARLSREEFTMYARPYCGHRRRLAAARRVAGADRRGPG